MPDGAAPKATFVKGDRVVVTAGDLATLEGALHDVQAWWSTLLHTAIDGLFVCNSIALLRAWGRRCQDTDVALCLFEMYLFDVGIASQACVLSCGSLNLLSSSSPTQPSNADWFCKHAFYDSCYCESYPSVKCSSSCL